MRWKRPIDREVPTRTVGASISAAFTISTLERETGVSRSTIHFYLREGLLPPPQKTAASRSLYGEEHVALLKKIAELKAAGHSLAEIRAALHADLVKARTNGVDLASEENERIRRVILGVATEEFAKKGYEQTLISDIVRRAGITNQVLYSHFPSKLQLFIESFHTFLTWNLAHVEPRLMQSPDTGERLLWRLLADARATQFGSEVLARIQAQRTDSMSDRRTMAEQAWQGVVDQITREFESARTPGAPPPPISLELLSYSMLGAHHNASLRASWDDECTREDVLRVHLWLWLAVMAALSGEVDIDSRLARYEALIKEVADREPETPPAAED